MPCDSAGQVEDQKLDPLCGGLPLVERDCYGSIACSSHWAGEVQSIRNLLQANEVKNGTLLIDIGALLFRDLLLNNLFLRDLLGDLLLKLLHDLLGDHLGDLLLRDLFRYGLLVELLFGVEFADDRERLNHEMALLSL